MQQIPSPIPPAPVWGILLALVGLAIVACIIGVVIVLLVRGKAAAAMTTIALFGGGFVLLCLLLYSVRLTAQSSTVNGAVATLGPSSLENQPPDDHSVRSIPVSASQPEAGSLSLPPESAKLPEWVSQPETTRGGTTTLVMSSQRFVTQEEAEQQLTGEVAKRVRQYFHEEHPSQGHWDLPSVYAVRRTVKQRHVELIPTKFNDETTVDMKRVHWQVELSRGVRNELYPIWRGQVVKQRLTQYGGGVGFAAFLLLVASTYFRVDARTRGAYRGWLRVASLSLVAAGGAAAFYMA